MLTIVDYALVFAFVGSSTLLAVVSFLWGNASKIMGAGILLASIFLSNVIDRFYHLSTLSAQAIPLIYALMDLILAVGFIEILRHSNRINRNNWAGYVAVVHLCMVVVHIFGIAYAGFAAATVYMASLNILMIVAIAICACSFTPKSWEEAREVLRAKLLYFRYDFFGRMYSLRQNHSESAYMIMKETGVNKIDEFIGSRLREIRVSKHMSLEEMAKATGISRAQIQRYESGVNRVTASGLFELARFFGVSTSFFYEGLEQGPRIRLVTRIKTEK
ncbi:MAG: helix-turn-helix transcriptional regulator [Amphiplicatus sp.]